jgi:hypothetical protein
MTVTTGFATGRRSRRWESGGRFRSFERRQPQSAPRSWFGEPTISGEVSSTCSAVEAETPQRASSSPGDSAAVGTSPRAFRLIGRERVRSTHEKAVTRLSRGDLAEGAAASEELPCEELGADAQPPRHSKAARRGDCHQSRADHRRHLQDLGSPPTRLPTEDGCYGVGVSPGASLAPVFRNDA